MCVVRHKETRSEEPERHEVSVKSNYFFEGDPRSFSRRLRVVLCVFFRVPVPVKRLLFVNMPFLVNLRLRVFRFLMDVVPRAKLFIEITETFLSEQS